VENAEGIVDFAPVNDVIKGNVEVTIRPVVPDDAALIAGLFNSLSPESIYNRFLSPMRRASPELLDRATKFDCDVEFALIACIPGPDGCHAIGVGRFKCCGPDRAEAAIVVADAWQRKGLATLILRYLAKAAVQRGIYWFDSTIDPNNKKLLKFAEAVGFKGTTKYCDGLLSMETDVLKLFLKPQEC
jgi:acetyltransferase